MSFAKAIIGTFLIALGIVAVFMTFTTPHSQPVSDIELRRDLFEQWKISYGKSYEISEEEEKRFKIWCENYDFVQEHNKIPENTYTVGMNVYADISSSEWKSIFSNCLKNSTTSPKNVRQIPIPTTLPAHVNWTESGAVTPIKNQLQCGACWAFSATGSLEGLNFIENGNLQSFSEQQLIDCSSLYGNAGCNGGLMDNAFRYVIAEGIETESTYPYIAATGTCRYSSAQVVYKNTGYTDVASQDNDALAAAVAVQPVSIAIEADQNVFQLYTGGIFNSSACGTNLDHGVLIVGYDTTGTTPYWIVKNSWGTAWGEAGYIRIYKQTGTGPGICGLALDPSYPTSSSDEKSEGMEGEYSEEMENEEEGSENEVTIMNEESMEEEFEEEGAEQEEFEEEEFEEEEEAQEEEFQEEESQGEVSIEMI